MTSLLDMRFLIISHHSVKFDGHRSREKEFIMFLICYMTLCGFVDIRPALEPTTMSSLVAIDLAKVEI